MQINTYSQHHVNNTDVLPPNNKDVKCRRQVENECTEVITLLCAINLKRRSLSFGKRAQDSISNNG